MSYGPSRHDPFVCNPEPTGRIVEESAVVEMRKSGGCRGVTLSIKMLTIMILTVLIVQTLSVGASDSNDTATNTSLTLSSKGAAGDVVDAMPPIMTRGATISLIVACALSFTLCGLMLLEVVPMLKVPNRDRFNGVHGSTGSTLA